MRALVTGGAGFVGRHLVELLVAQGVATLVVDDLSVGRHRFADEPLVTTVVASLGDPEAGRAIEEFRPDLVFHLAARHFIPWCEEHPDETERTNVEGTRWLLDVLDRLGPTSFVLASTVAVYGFSELPVTEQDPRRPSSVYARTKAQAEDLVAEYAARHPAGTVAIGRLANVYGPGDPNDHLVPRICRELGGEIRLGNLWPLRDYIHVTDVARALRTLADLAPGLHTYVVGTGTATSVESVVQVLAEASGLPTTVVSDPALQRADDGHLVADPTALRRATGWSPLTSLEDGLRDTLRSVRPWPHRVVDVLGTKVSAVTRAELVADLERALDTGTRLTVTFANPNYVMAAAHDGRLLGWVNAFDHVLTDGWGVMLAARMLGQRIPARLANDDLVEPIFGLLAAKGASVFFLGSAPGVAEAASERLTAHFRGLRVAGTFHGFLDVEEGTPGEYSPAAFDRMVEAVNAAGPDVLVVGIPTPNQQRFVVENAHRLRATVILTGGSWIDHLAERIEYYPRPVTALGLRWAYRWAHEPRRLARRYTVELARFGVDVLRQRVSAGDGGGAGPRREKRGR